MPFDVAAHPAAPAAFAAQPADLAAAYAEAGELDACWAAANPDRALAFLMVCPQPGAALDALLAA